MEPDDPNQFKSIQQTLFNKFHKPSKNLWLSLWLMKMRFQMSKWSWKMSFRWSRNLTGWLPNLKSSEGKKSGWKSAKISFNWMTKTRFFCSTGPIQNRWARAPAWVASITSLRTVQRWNIVNSVARATVKTVFTKKGCILEAVSMPMVRSPEAKSANFATGNSSSGRLISKLQWRLSITKKGPSSWKLPLTRPKKTSCWMLIREIRTDSAIEKPLKQLKVKLRTKKFYWRISKWCTGLECSKNSNLLSKSMLSSIEMEMNTHQMRTI